MGSGCSSYNLTDGANRAVSVVQRNISRNVPRRESESMNPFSEKDFATISTYTAVISRENNTYSNSDIDCDYEGVDLKGCSQSSDHHHAHINPSCSNEIAGSRKILKVADMSGRRHCDPYTFLEAEATKDPEFSIYTDIDASACDLTDLPLLGLPNIISLNLNDNSFISFPVDVFHLDNLKELHLANQGHHTLRHVKTSFSTDNWTDGRPVATPEPLLDEPSKLCVIPNDIVLCKALQELHLGNNEISSLPETFEGLKNLQHLDLYNNSFKVFPDCLCRMKWLKCLILSHNEIHSLPNTLGEMKGLETLRLSDNMLRTVPDSICSLVDLELLTLRRNRLQQLPIRLTNLTKLKQTHDVSLDETQQGHKGLFLEDNKFQFPPQKTCNKGVEAVFSYLRKAAENPHLDRLQPSKNCLGVLKEKAADPVSLNDAFLMDLAKDIGFEWESLATYLAIPKATVEQIKIDYHGRCKMQIFTVLRNWRDNNSYKGQKYLASDLSNALIKVDSRDLAEKVAKRCSLQMSETVVFYV